MTNVPRTERSAGTRRGPGLDRLARSVVGDRGTSEQHVAVVARELPGDQRQHVLAPRAGDAGHPDDLAGVDVEIDPLDAATAKASNGDQGLAAHVRLTGRGGLHAVADDELHEAEVVEVGHGHGCRQLAVAQHGDAIGELEHLVEVVRDVHDRHAPLLQAVDDLEQAVDIVARQRRRRLVEHEQVGSVLPVDEGAGDRHRGPLRRWQVADRRLDVDVGEAEHVEGLAGATDLVAPADLAEPSHVVAGREGDVLDRAQRADEPEVLVHEADPGRGGGVAVAEGEGLVVVRPRLSARVRLVIAGEHLDEGRLAGSVLADESVDLAGLDGDRDVGQRDLSRERLREMFDAQHFSQWRPPDLAAGTLASCSGCQ